MITIYVLLYATILNMIISPIMFVYKQQANAVRVIYGIIYGLFWPISFPIGVVVFCYYRWFRK